MTEEVKPPSIELATLKPSKKIYEQFTQEFRELYLISGKKADEWQSHFQLQIPPDCDSTTLKELDTQLAGMFEEAAFLKTMADCRLQAYKTSNASRYREAYASLVQSYKEESGPGKRLPAKDTLQVLAEEQIGSSTDGIVHAEIELAFFKGIVDKLNTLRKIIENISLNIAIEGKALHYQSFLSKQQSGE